MLAAATQRTSRARLDRTTRRLRPLACAGLLAAIASIGGAFASPAHAGDLTLASTFAGPISASMPLCTAEPRALVYGTTNFNSSQPINHRSNGFPGVGFYEPANAPSYLDLVPSLQAGARSDLCVGFTLPPNVEPALVRDWVNNAPRLQDDPAWPDVAGTHVSTFPDGSLPEHGDDLRTLALALPAGYMADFASAPQCSDADFGVATYAASTCAASAQIGEAFVRVSAYAAGVAKHDTLTGLQLTNLAPASGEVGRLGLSIKAHATLAPAKWVVSVRLATDGSGRLVAHLTDAPRLTYDTTSIATVGAEWGGDDDDVLAPGDPRIGQPQPGAQTRPLYVEGLSLRLWGAKSAHPSLASDFGAQAGQCADAQTAGVDLATYAGHRSTATTSAYGLSDCGSLSLPATATASLEDPTAGAATGATFSIQLPQSGTRLPAQPRALELALPEGLAIGPQLASGASGLPICTATEFGADSSQPSGCPAASAIGTAAVSALVTDVPFTGAMYLGAPGSAAELASVHVDVAQPGASGGARLKFSGALSASAEGLVTLRFPALPTLRMTEIDLTLRGGEHAVFTAPRACGVHQSGITLERSSGSPTVVPADVSVSAGCDQPPALQVRAAATTAASGGRPATSISLLRTASTAPLVAATVNLPPGMMVAPSSIPVCAAPQAAVGDCTAASQLGSVSLLAGAGSTPLTLTGDVFLTATPEGSLAGGVLVVPVTLGELSLGSLVAPVTFTLDASARFLAVSVTLPERIGGLDLDLRQVTLDLDRDGVVRQPTGCGDLPVRARAIAGDRELTAATTVAFSGCRAAAFDPAFAAVTSGESTVGGRPKISVSVTPRAGDAGVRTVAFTIPQPLALDVPRTVTPCELAVFETASCPAASRVGVAGGKVSIAGDFLGGDAVLLRLPGEPSLGLGIRFLGSFGHRAVGRFTATAGATILTFDDLPDLPLSRWALQLDGGPSGLFAYVTPGAGCANTAQWAADLTAHSGTMAQRTAAASCPTGGRAGAQSPTVALSVSAKTGIKLKLTQFAGQQLQAVKLTMPRAIRINAPKAKRRGRTSIALIGAKATPTFSKGSLTLSTYGGVPSEVVARLRITAYTVGGRAPDLAAGQLKGKKRLAAFRLRLAFRDGTVQERTVSVRLP